MSVCYKKESEDLALWVWTGASAFLRCYWPHTGKALGPSVSLTSPSAPGHLPETQHGGRHHGTEPWREEGMVDRINTTRAASCVQCWMSHQYTDAYSPSRLHSTLGAGRPLTLHWNSTSWPRTTVSSCSRDVPEITGGAVVYTQTCKEQSR